MNIKTTNSQLSTTESKTKQNKANNQNRNGSIHVEIIWRVINWESKGQNGEMVQGLRSITGRNKIGGY